MATWAIGDIHGCYDSLEALWRRLEFDRAKDRLWLVGDLVNRGPKSLAVLRWARRLSEALGDRMAVVLGNHDLHLLALERRINPPKHLDTLDEVLAAPDRSELVAWLRRQSFLEHRGDLVLVHAGLLPSWSLDEAERRADELERLLDSPGESSLLARRPSPSQDGVDEEQRRALAALTLLRTCSRHGEPCHYSGPPEGAPEGCLPWYELWRPSDHGVTVVCGHWAAQGLRVEPDMIALDSACVWGGSLTAVRLEDRRLVQQPALETTTPEPDDS